jgi:uncharacterized protein DUF1524
MARRSKSRTLLPLVLVAIVAVAAALLARQHSTGTGTPTARPSAAASAALQQLAALPVKPAGTLAGYDRDRFGPAWADENNNGCDTRDDILARDLTGIRRDSDGCTVESGVLHDPYTGHTIHFRRGVGTSTAVQIDHLVALADAWRTGAAAWPAAKREKLANDPRELLAVDGPANESKGDQDASQWLPPNRAYDCTYVIAQIQVKTSYGLWVTSSEHDAMATTLHRC